jgi:hypothetical protein
MKTLLKVVIGIAVAIALGIAAVFYFSAGMVDTASAFFEAVKKHDLTAARSYLSEDFKASTDEAALEEFLAKSALTQFREASWSNRQFSGGRGELDGVVTTDSGGSVPLKVTFVKENGSWKIYAIRKPAAGLQTETASPGVPGKPAQVALIRQSIRDFAASVDARNMEHFHGTLSHLWQKQTTAAELDKIFGNTYDAGLNFAVFDGVEPELEPVAALDDNGVLVLKGHFPTKPQQFHFQQKYIYEGTDWKLVGFSYEIR